MTHPYRDEFAAMVRLAAPLVIADIGWMTMGIVDTMMLGRVSAAAMGGASIGHGLFLTIAIFGMGLMLGLDTLVSQAFGAGRVADCHRSLVTGVWLALLATPPLMAVVLAFVPLLSGFGIHPAVLAEAIPYLKALNWSALPLMLYFGLRRYLQGMSIVKPVTFALISANLVNVAANWVLIFGHFGFRAMGAEGAGWATCLSRIYLTVVLMGFALYYDQRRRSGLLDTPLLPERARLIRLFRLGLPAAAQMTVEIAVFALVSALIGKLDPVSLAGHQIALNAASFTFMIPLGVSSAAAVRVGQALGRGDIVGAGRSGWTAMVLGAAFMSCAAAAFWLLPGYIARLFTANEAVIQAGISLLFVAAFFQLFDGLQIVATGALRGAGDTRTPMITHLLGYWIIGLPLGYVLCFGWGWGALGLWVGLCVALILIGLVLVGIWRRQVSAFRSVSFAEADG